MDRTTITLDLETRRRLRRIASERGISMATVIREAIDTTIERHLAEAAAASERERPERMTLRGRTADERPEPRSWR